MTENMLVSLDDAALDNVNGGLTLGLTVNETTLAGATVDLTKTGLHTSLTLFGKSVSIDINSPITVSFG